MAKPAQPAAPCPALLCSCVPRALSLRVRDERPVPREERNATEAQLLELLQALLGSAGIGTSAGARYGLDIVVRRPVDDDLGMDPSACVEMSWGLRVAASSASTSTNSACSEVQDGYGATAPDISRAFRRAIRAQLAELERNAADTVALTAPLEFPAAQLTVPGFAWLISRSLALEVKDELGAGGAAGAALTRSLTEARLQAGLHVGSKTGSSFRWCSRAHERPDRSRSAGAAWRSGPS